jgi:formamidopyrimidine-DNA glycosylase
MPELPEVETTRRGVAPWIEGVRVSAVSSCASRCCAGRCRAAWRRELPGRRVLTAGRRAKYLLFRTEGDRTLMMHLGMSGSLRVLQAAAMPGRTTTSTLRWKPAACCASTTRADSAPSTGSPGDPLQHPLLRELGPEPLGPEFTPEYLAAACRGPQGGDQAADHERPHRRRGRQHLRQRGAVSRRHPPGARRRPDQRGTPRPAGRARSARCSRRPSARAARRCGTSPGVRASAAISGRSSRPTTARGEPCLRCDGTIRGVVQGQRSTYYCPGCQLNLTPAPGAHSSSGCPQGVGGVATGCARSNSTWNSRPPGRASS